MKEINNLNPQTETDYTSTTVNRNSASYIIAVFLIIVLFGSILFDVFISKPTLTHKIDEIRIKQDQMIEQLGEFIETMQGRSIRYNSLTETQDSIRIEIQTLKEDMN